MKSPIVFVVGIVVALLGLLFTLQGFDVLGGSGGMNGSGVWKVLGPVILLVGLAVVARSRTARSS